MRAKLNDYKDWIQERADEIADEKYNKDFYGLTERQQTKAYNRAENDHTDACSAWCDAIFERMRYDI